jgi:hypothetical protein
LLLPSAQSGMSKEQQRRKLCFSLAAVPLLCVTACQCCCCWHCYCCFCCFCFFCCCCCCCCCC